MGTNTSFGVSRLDKNQTPVLDGWSSAIVEVDAPIAMQAPTTPTEAPDSPAVEARPSVDTDTCEPEDAPETAVESAPSHRTTVAQRDARSRTAHQLLVITALTTLFWAPMALLLNWIG